MLMKLWKLGNRVNLWKTLPKTGAENAGLEAMEETPSSDTRCKPGVG